MAKIVEWYKAAMRLRTYRLQQIENALSALKMWGFFAKEYEGLDTVQAIVKHAIDRKQKSSLAQRSG